MRAAGTTHGGGKSDDAVDDAATRNPHTIRNRREKARASMNQSTNGVRDAACPLGTRGRTRLVRLVRGRGGGGESDRSLAEPRVVVPDEGQRRLGHERHLRDAACPISTG